MDRDIFQHLRNQEGYQNKGSKEVRKVRTGGESIMSKDARGEHKIKTRREIKC